MHKSTTNKCTPSALFALLAAAFLLPAPAHAEVDALVRDALALTESSQSAKAFEMLSAREAERAGDPDFDTVLGIAANETGQYTLAIFALERVLAVQPENARARAELGRALFAVGDTQGARRLLQETRSQGVPNEAALTIDQFLQAIDRVEAAGRSSLRGYAEAGIGRDSNANSGPSISTVAVPALPGSPFFTLAPSGVETAGSFVSLAGGLTGRYVIDPRWSLIGNAAVNTRNHSGRADQFDVMQLDVSGGAAYRVERNEYSVVLNRGIYNVDGNRLRDQSGATAEWTYRFDSFRQLNTYFQYSDLTYPGQGLRDVGRSVLGVSYAHQLRSGVIGFGGLYFGEEDPKNAGVPHVGHKFTGLRLGAQKPIGETLAVFAGLGYEERRFGGPDPLFVVTRNDKQTNFNVGLTWVPATAWRVTPQFSYTRTTSNVAIADFDKRVISVTARREF